MPRRDGTTGWCEPRAEPGGTAAAAALLERWRELGTRVEKRCCQCRLVTGPPPSRRSVHSGWRVWRGSYSCTTPSADGGAGRAGQEGCTASHAASQRQLMLATRASQHAHWGAPLQPCRQAGGALHPRAPAVPRPSTEWSSFTISAVTGTPTDSADTRPGPAWRSCAAD